MTEVNFYEKRQLSDRPDWDLCDKSVQFQLQGHSAHSYLREANCSSCLMLSVSQVVNSLILYQENYDYCCRPKQQKSSHNNYSYNQQSTTEWVSIEF